MKVHSSAHATPQTFPEGVDVLISSLHCTFHPFVSINHGEACASFLVVFGVADQSRGLL